MRSRILAALVAALALAGCGGAGGTAAPRGASTASSRHAATQATPSPSAGQREYTTPYGPSPHAPGWGSTPPGFTLPHFLPAATATAEMFDTITLSTVPAHPFALAGYTAGFWPTFNPLRAAWPTAHTVSIAISWGYHADCLDVEPGDAQPWQAGAWALADIRAGFAHPCLYGSLSEMPAIQSSLAASLGANWRARVFLWLAWYRFVPGLVARYDAVQWNDHAYNRNLDESTVTLDFLTIAHPPYVAHPQRPVVKPKPPAPKPLPWSSAEVQVHGTHPNGSVTLKVKNGRWIVSGPLPARVRPLPYNAKPLGS